MTLSTRLGHTTLARRMTFPCHDHRKRWKDVAPYQASLPWQGQARCTDPTGTKAIVVTSAWWDANPMPCCTDKTTPPRGDSDRYNDHRPNTSHQVRYTVLPNTWWKPRRGSQHRGRPDWLKALTPTIGVVALSLVKRPDERQPGVATYYWYDALGNLEKTTKTMTDTALHRTADEPPMCLQCLPRSAQKHHVSLKGPCLVLVIEWQP
jgi:hypothetical protein